MKTIFYELNEVPRRIFKLYADAAPGSSFGKLNRFGKLFETVTQDVGHLSPWITWPSLHRGVSNFEHKISDLGQDLTHVDKDFPPVWDLLAKQGVKVGMFGSLQSYPLPKNLDNYEFYVPDTFAAGPECFPKTLSEFQKFNLGMVSANGRNVSTGLPLKDAARFLMAAPGLGLRARTVGKIANQLVAERLDKKRVVRRRTSQVQIAFDFFLKELMSKQPDVSFFFTNHVASSMHRYWPSIFPKDYPEGKFDAAWLTDWKNEIPYAVHQANDQLAELIRFVDNHPGYRLVVLSSMGQAAVADVEPISNQVLITDLEKLLSSVGMPRDEWEPRLTMAPLVVVNLKSAEGEEKLRKVEGFKINGSGIVCEFLGQGDVRLDIQINNVDEVHVTDATGASLNAADIGVEKIDLQDASGSYAYHIPEGILIQYDGMGDGVGNESGDWRQISALDVAPSILNNFDIAAPSHMAGDRSLFTAGATA
ncbi:MAG: hypothetical protein AAGF28_13010 [Pseudomonadota bacterium]